MRDPDALDYALVAAVSALAYLELPWRPAVRARLRALAGWLGSPRLPFGVEPYLVLLGLLAVAFLVLVIEVAPDRL